MVSPDYRDGKDSELETGVDSGHGSMVFRTRPMLHSVAAVALALTTSALVAVFVLPAGLGGFPALEGGIWVVILFRGLYVCFGLVLILWAVRRLTEEVVLTDQGVVYSVLWRKTFIRYGDIVGIENRYLFFKATSSPERLTVIEDVRKRHLSFSSYLCGYDRLVEHISARASVECPSTISPSRWSKLANWIAVIVFILCMAVLAFTIWLNR